MQNLAAFDGFESGYFGGKDYVRGLSAEEAELEEASCRAAGAEYLAQARFARKLWFKLAKPTDPIAEIGAVPGAGATDPNAANAG